MGASIIQSLIAPVVMISASGLLYMGLNARLGRILSRIRSFHLERLNICKTVHESKENLTPEITLRFEGVFVQGGKLLTQAHLIKNSIISGYPLYPIASFRLTHVDWTLPLALQEYLVETTKHYAFFLTPKEYENSSLIQRIIH